MSFPRLLHLLPHHPPRPLSLPNQLRSYSSLRDRIPPIFRPYIPTAFPTGSSPSPPPPNPNPNNNSNKNNEDNGENKKQPQKTTPNIILIGTITLLVIDFLLTKSGVGGGGRGEGGRKPASKELWEEVRKGNVRVRTKRRKGEGVKVVGAVV